ncbi:TRAF-type domain-containing protein [Plasmodiophora brassicae]|uniref:TRAF-type domain-containing protein n=1 Tax=Plasmodiophora brassicae TaxID=37360 RepID=A0A0G4IT17_PLABS|nr:hypothetical protein PBRA_006524 [Plasmodiophora brassicae]SPQ94496.1 unnamed protein product [Plasmodiophora brassicae]
MADANSARRRRAEADPPSTSSKRARGPAEPLRHGFKLNEDDLKCVVCLEFPVGTIVQCANGHLLCTDCHERVVEAYQCVCPTCRVKLSRDRPSRNRFAESVLATVIVPCGNAGCQERLAFAKVHEHQSDLCPYRMSTCKFAPLGCDWRDHDHKLKAHQRECTMRHKSVKSILKKVVERDNNIKAEEIRQRERFQAQIKVAELLNSRCRDICIREVVIERDEICDIVCSKPFRVFGVTMSLELVIDEPAVLSSPPPAVPPPPAISSADGAEAPVEPPPVVEASSSSDSGQQRPADKSSVGLVLTQRSRRVKRMRMSVFLMKGPDSEMTFAPVVQNVHFTRSKRNSEKFPLPLTAQAARDLFEMGSLTLRIGMVDRRRGLSRSFSSEGADARDDGGDSMTSSSSDDDGLMSDDGDEGGPDQYYSSSEPDSEDLDCLHFMEEDDDNHYNGSGSEY